MSVRPTRIGVVSDTHGLLRPQTLEALAGSELILHAGDIGSPEVLEGLRAIAPVIAVRGNNDRESWSSELPLREVVEVAGARLFLVHEPAHVDVDPAGEALQAVITGHTHRPLCEWREGVLYLNPGSAGPRRFTLPVAVAQIEVEGERVTAAEIVELSI